MHVHTLWVYGNKTARASLEGTVPQVRVVRVRPANHWTQFVADALRVCPVAAVYHAAGHH